MDFLLKKGKHPSTPRKFKIYACTTEFEWNITFSKECWYERNQVEFSGVNKLRGVTFGIHGEKPFGQWNLTKWLVNSALLGWQPQFNDINKENINLYLYYDINGVESREIFKTVKIEENFKIKYSIKDDGVYIVVNDEDTYYLMPTKTWLKIGYHLHPYFGGKSTSPQDMVVTIN